MTSDSLVYKVVGFVWLGDCSFSQTNTSLCDEKFGLGNQMKSSLPTHVDGYSFH